MPCGDRGCNRKVQREVRGYPDMGNLYEGMNGGNMGSTQNLTGWDAFWFFCSMILVLIIFLVIFGFIVQISWNMVVPDVFGFRELDLGQGIALFILAALLIRIR
ncbi:MAG: hypothetical protein Terrestrivirus2_53 [Terrestrivirus sp.]|uniref:Uncharacterized protein n=1 Tax=Terrestrivirus sp. TaxID=2487775 RepID=A0A3G4ZL35_9VIRU|nr:MAG: hypothetical protein Terrestrivirus2_53 [Terrestrivirus sp.]